MLAHKLHTVSASLITILALSLAACGGDSGSSEPGGTGGAAPRGGAGGQSSSSGGSVGTGGAPGNGGTLGSGGAANGGAVAKGGSAGAPSAGAAGSLGRGGAGTGGAAGGASAGSAGKPSSGGAGGAAAGAGGSGTAGGAGTGGAAGSGSGGAAGGGGSDSFKPCPATGACKIMPFGDSITQGFNVNGGYRAPLFHLALAASRDITFVGSASDYAVATVDGTAFPKNHEGHGGYTIEGNNGIAQFVATSIPNYKPNIITLMIGTNDINGNVSVSDAPNRLGKLLDSIHTRDPNILVIVAQIVPSRTDGTNNAIKTYNAAIPAQVSSRVSQGHHIVLVDMYSAFTKDSNFKNSLLNDNLHPNQAGYNLMADVWFKALDPYLP